MKRLLSYKSNGVGKLWENRADRLSVVADKSQVYPDDPGQGTPAMVYKTDKNGYITHSATLTCAMNEGELDGSGELIELSNRAVKWLEKIEPEVDEFLYGAAK